MATRFIFGKKGGGKSYLAAKWLIEELRTGTRDVVTNLAVDLPKLARYIESHCPETAPDAWKRVRIIEDRAQLKEWYRYRGGTCVLQHATDHEGAEWGLLDWTPARDLPPVLYIIDEAHIPFGAREFAKTGKAVLSFLSQSRKLGDEVVLISQKPEQVDKQMRGQVDEWTHAVNLQNLGFLSIFQLPKRILWTSYASLPSGMKREPAQARGWIRVDPKGIGSTYDTNAGVGIKGNGEPAKKQKRLSLLWLIPVPFLVWAGCKGGMNAITAGASQLVPKTHTSTNGTPSTAATLAQKLLPIPPQAQNYAAQITAPSPHVTPPPPVCVGWAKLGRDKTTAFLSDGSEWTPRTGLQNVSPQGVRIMGTNYSMARQTVTQPLNSPRHEETSIPMPAFQP